MEKTERRRRFLINLAYCAAILAVLVVLFRYMMSSLLPFFIAFIVAAVIHPLLDKLVKKCHLPHKFMGIVLIVLVYTLLAFLGIILCDKIAAFVQRMIVMAPRTWSGTLLPALRSIWESMTAFLARWDIEIDIAMDQVLATLDASMKTLSAKAVALVGNFAVSVPGKLVNTIICIVSTVFILLDWEAIGKFIHGQMPEKASEVMKDGWSQLKKTIGKYIRSYGLIMLMTFTELAIGLLIIGVDNSWGVAAGIAVLDILPIVGCGTVLIPWAVVSLVTGKTGIGIICNNSHSAEHRRAQDSRPAGGIAPAGNAARHGDRSIAVRSGRRVCVAHSPGCNKAAGRRWNNTRDKKTKSSRRKDSGSRGKT